MRIIALDVSKNRIGLAVSDMDNDFIAFETTLFPKQKSFKSDIKQIFIKYQPVLTFVGLPYTNNEIFIRRFTHNIKYIIGKYLFIDESFSTITAQKLLSAGYCVGSKSIDSLAAKLLLMNAIHIVKNPEYLDNIVQRNGLNNL